MPLKNVRWEFIKHMSKLEVNMSKPVKKNIDFKDLEKIDIRVGMIESLEILENSKKLVKLQVDFGEFKRQILVGMQGERENVMEVVGVQALFVVNLEAKKMAGEISEGMLFDIGYESGITPVLAVPEKSVPNGTIAG